MKAEQKMMPSWLTRKRGEQAMDEEFREPPPIATIPLPATSPSPQAATDSDLAQMQPHDMTLQEAAEMIRKYHDDKAQWTQLAGESMTRIKDLVREIEFLKLELVETKNNLQTAQAIVEDMRQENSDLRALQTEQHAMAKHLVARYENYHIPLPIRAKRKNGNGDKKVQTVIPGIAPSAESVQKP